MSLESSKGRVNSSFFESSRKYSYLLKSEAIINKLRYIRLVVVSRSNHFDFK